VTVAVEDRILAIFHIGVNDEDVILSFGNLEIILSAISFCRKKNRYNKFLTKHPTSEMTKTLLLIPR
jgi:hypothetical protein